MTNVFYFLVLLCIFIKIFSLFQISDIHKLMKHIKMNKYISGFNHIKVFIYLSSQLFYVIVCIIGLMSSHGIIFILICIFSFITNQYLLARYTSNIMSIILLIFIIINHYYLHFNIFTI